MTRAFIRQNKVQIAILLYGAIMYAIYLAQPSFIFNSDGSFKDFGLGYTTKTIFPIWYVVIIAAVLSYWWVLWLLR